MNSKKIGKFLKELREKNSYTQQQLADKIPISRQAISKWELGKALPEHTALSRLSEIFNVTIDELLAGEEHTDKNVVLELYKERNKSRKIIKYLFLGLLLLLFTFFAYYFFNHFNSVKIYKIYGKIDQAKIENGLFIKTNEKIYFDIGNIEVESKDSFEKLEVFYKLDNEEHFIYSSDCLQISLNDYFGYEEYFSFKQIDSIMKNLYIRLLYDDRSYEIKLSFEEDYKNNLIFLFKKRKISNEIQAEKKEDELLDKIVQSFDKEGNIYNYKIADNKKDILFTYFEDTNLLTLEIMEQNKLIEDWILNFKTSLLTYNNYKNESTYYCTIDIFTKKCISGECVDYENNKKNFIEYLNNIKST